MTCILRHQAWPRWNLQLFVKIYLNTLCIATSKSKKTNKDESFVLHNDRETGIIIFSCTSNLRCPCNEVQEIFIDGTFKCCSKYFLQNVQYSCLANLN
jgi:hypothetical protein